MVNGCPPCSRRLFKSGPRARHAQAGPVLVGGIGKSAIGNWQTRAIVTLSVGRADEGLTTAAASGYRVVWAPAIGLPSRCVVFSSS